MVNKSNGKTLLRSISCDRHVLRAYNEPMLAMRMSNHVQLADAIHAGYVIGGTDPLTSPPRSVSGDHIGLSLRRTHEHNSKFA